MNRTIITQWLMASMVFVIGYLLAGCQTTRLHTQQELKWLGIAIASQAADVTTTAIALQRDDMREGNPVWGDDVTVRQIAAVKCTFLLAAYLASYAYPDSRVAWYKWIAGTGSAAASWNTYQLVDR